VKAFFRVLPNRSLIPHDNETKEYIGRREVGQIISADIKMARNYGNHRRYFSFINATFGMQDHFEEIEAYRYWLTMKCGFFDTIIAPNGTTMFKPKSIAFDSMDEDEFKRVFSESINVFLKYFGGDLTENDVLQAISYD